MNYNTIISKLRELARDGLRLDLVARFRADMQDANISIDNLNKTIESYEKELAVNAYNLSKVDPADPNAEEKTKHLNASTESLNQVVENLKKNIEADQKYIADLEAKIAKVQSGETKVSKDSLNDRTNSMVTLFVNEQVRQLNPVEIDG